MDVLLLSFVPAVGALQPAENDCRQYGEGPERQERLVQAPDQCASANVRSYRNKERGGQAGCGDAECVS